MAMFQHTAARRRLRLIGICQRLPRLVSTHSRTKAAATNPHRGAGRFASFNTQPHEGGCAAFSNSISMPRGFNTQPHEGGCGADGAFHSLKTSFNTQPHEGGCGEFARKPAGA